MLLEIKESKGLYLPRVESLREAASEFVNYSQKIGVETTRFAMIEESEFSKIITSSKETAARRRFTPFRLTFLDSGFMDINGLNLVESSSLDCFIVGDLATRPVLFRKDDDDEKERFEFLDVNHGLGVEPDGSILATDRDLLPRDIASVDSIPSLLSIHWELESGIIQKLTEQLKTR